MALTLSSKLGFHSQVLQNILFSSFHCYNNLRSFSSQANLIDEKPGPNQIEGDGSVSSNMSNFLVKTLGFSQSQLSSVMKNHSDLFRPTKNPLMRAQDAVKLFREYGFTNAQIRSTIVKSPFVFSLRADDNMRPKLELIKSIGFSKNDLGHVLSRAPRVLCLKDLDKKIDRWRSYFYGNANLLKALKKFPNLLCCNLETGDKQKRFLRQCGIPEDWIFDIICKVPAILSRSIEATESRLKYFRDLGVAENSRIFANILAESMTVSLDKMDEKLKMLGTLGLSEEEMYEMVRKYPLVLLFSCEKIKKTTEYLMQNGVPPNALVKTPMVMGLSLEKRIKPRLNVYKILSGSSQSKRFPSILTFLSMSEKLFLERYVISHPDSQKLFEILGHHNQGSAKAAAGKIFIESEEEDCNTKKL